MEYRKLLIFGGAERDRTAGLLVANEALSQLSYSPTIGEKQQKNKIDFNSGKEIRKPRLQVPSQAGAHHKMPAFPKT